MTATEIINRLEEAYTIPELTYETMLSHFSNLSGISFHSVIVKARSPVIRARYSDSGKSFRKLEEMSYPPKEFVNDFSRLNRPNQNQFYGSESEDACILEMLPIWFDSLRTGDIITVTLGFWQIRYDMRLLIIPDSKNNSQLNRETIQKMRPEEFEFWDYISNKFMTSTKDDKKIYEFTAAFANVLWMNDKNQSTEIPCNGFLYSSVQSKQDLNVALSPETIDAEFLTPMSFEEFKVERTGTNEAGLPTYIALGNRKQGVVNFDRKEIEWIH